MLSEADAELVLSPPDLTLLGPVIQQSRAGDRLTFAAAERCSSPHACARASSGAAAVTFTQPRHSQLKALYSMSTSYYSTLDVLKFKCDKNQCVVENRPSKISSENV